MSKLTTEHWLLHDYIESETKKGTERITVKMICEALPQYFQYKETESNFTNCPRIYKLIDEINDSAECDHIIIKKNNNFRLATEQEYIDYFHKLDTMLKRISKKKSAVKRKYNRNGYVKLLNNQLNPIQKGNAEVVEAILQ